MVLICQYYVLRLVSTLHVDGYLPWTSIDTQSLMVSVTYSTSTAASSYVTPSLPTKEKEISAKIEHMLIAE